MKSKSLMIKVGKGWVRIEKRVDLFGSKNRVNLYRVYNTSKPNKS